MVMEYSRSSSPAFPTASPTHSKFLIKIHQESGKFVSSTPAATARPLPAFIEAENRLFQFRNQLSLSRSMIPKSPMKSAPPVSRVFPRRQWAPEKAHAISFRDESNRADAAIQSRFYDSKCPELYFEQCFVIEKKLGEGSFGEVMKVKSLDNGKCYAVKRSSEKFRSEADRMRKLDEVKKHEQLPKHPNCVEFVQAWEENHRLYIQTELCMMSVEEYRERKGYLSKETVWNILIDLLHGLNHIHKHGFVHLDIKPANIFLSGSGACKIGDFGLVIDHNDVADAREGDNKYMAPELLESIFSTKADVFSLGIATLELASNIELPRQGTPWRLLRLGYIPPECIELLGTNLHCIIQWMLTPSYKERPSIEQILQHPILVSQCWNRLPFKITGTCASFCYSLISFVLCLFLRFLTLPFSILLRSAARSRMNERGRRLCFVSTGVLDSDDDRKWESTEYCGFHPLSQRPSSVFFTPAIKSRSSSRFTPTPRNSSPLAIRTKLSASCAGVSPDISPLSQSKSYRDRLDSTGKNHSNADGLDSFLSGFNDRYNSTYCDSLLASKPRNLLEMLNNVSDSENSF